MRLSFAQPITERERDVLFLLALGYTKSGGRPDAFHLGPHSRDAPAPHIMQKLKLKDPRRARALRARQRTDRPPLAVGWVFGGTGRATRAAVRAVRMVPVPRVANRWRSTLRGPREEALDEVEGDVSPPRASHCRWSVRVRDPGPR